MSRIGRPPPGTRGDPARLAFDTPLVATMPSMCDLTLGRHSRCGGNETRDEVTCEVDFPIHEIEGNWFWTEWSGAMPAVANAATFPQTPSLEGFSSAELTVVTDPRFDHIIWRASNIVDINNPITFHRSNIAESSFQPSTHGIPAQPQCGPPQLRYTSDIVSLRGPVTHRLWRQERGFGESVIPGSAASSAFTRTRWINETTYPATEDAIVGRQFIVPSTNLCRGESYFDEFIMNCDSQNGGPVGTVHAFSFPLFHVPRQVNGADPIGVSFRMRVEGQIGSNEFLGAPWPIQASAHLVVWTDHSVPASSNRGGVPVYRRLLFPTIHDGGLCGSRRVDHRALYAPSLEDEIIPGSGRPRVVAILILQPGERNETRPSSIDNGRTELTVTEFEFLNWRT